MIGAIIRIFEGELDIAQKVVRENVPAKPEANAEAAKLAFQSVKGPDAKNEYLLYNLHSPIAEEEGNGVLVLEEKSQKQEKLGAPYWDVPMSRNKTGNWRLLTPTYITKTPPCNANCPAGTDVREFVRLASEKKYDEAYDVIYRHNPFPGICGRVCPHFCEQTCNRFSFDGSVNIGLIERFLGDRKRQAEVHTVKSIYEEKIAVIGSGPAGLTAALRLRDKGYEVTVFEALFPLFITGGPNRFPIATRHGLDPVLRRKLPGSSRHHYPILCAG